MKKSGVKILQEYWDNIRKDHNWEYEIKWVPGRGYYAYPDSPLLNAHFLGKSVEDAKTTLKFYSEP